MAIRFDDRVAIVTGGRAGPVARACCWPRRGAKVVVNDPGGAVDGRGGPHAVADAVVAEIQAPAARRWRIIIRSPIDNSAQNIVDTAIKTWGRLDILVNNAGVLRDKAFNNITMEDYEFAIQVHHYGTVYCTKAAWPVMRKQLLRPHRRYDLRLRHRRQFRPDELRRGEDGGERADQRAAAGRREIQHPVQRDLAVGAHAHDEGAAAAGHRDVDEAGIRSPAVTWLCSKECDEKARSSRHGGRLRGCSISRRGRAVRSGSAGDDRDAGGEDRHDPRSVKGEAVYGVDGDGGG